MKHDDVEFVVLVGYVCKILKKNFAYSHTLWNVHIIGQYRMKVLHLKLPFVHIKQIVILMLL